MDFLKIDLQILQRTYFLAYFRAFLGFLGKKKNEKMMGFFLTKIQKSIKIKS